MDEAKQPNPRLAATLQALLVTFLWSTSWVLVKFGLEDLPPLVFAGLRYTAAFLALLAYFLRARGWKALGGIGRRDWGLLVLYGLVYYTLTQGTSFLGLKYLPAITFSLLLNFSGPLIAIMGIFFLAEKLWGLQWVGIGVFLAGVGVYFYPDFIPPGMALGLAVGMSSVLATSIAAVLGRFVNRGNRLDALTVTVTSMGAGALALLGIGLAVEGWPPLDPVDWAIILWLALVNTAFAFTLWNHTLRTLTATESGMINNTMLVQIAVLAWVFLGERPGGKEIVGMGIAAAGVFMVNWRRRV